MSITPSHWVFHLVILMNRLSLGLYFLLAGVYKFKGGLSNFYQNSFLAFKPDWLPDMLVQPYGYAVPFLEVILGAMLVVGMFGRGVVLVLALMLLSFTIALMGAKGISGGTGGPFHQNVILITLALLLAITGSGRYSIDTGWLSKRRALPRD